MADTFQQRQIADEVRGEVSKGRAVIVPVGVRVVSDQVTGRVPVLDECSTVCRIDTTAADKERRLQGPLVESGEQPPIHFLRGERRDHVEAWVVEGHRQSGLGVLRRSRVLARNDSCRAREGSPERRATEYGAHEWATLRRHWYLWAM